VGYARPTNHAAGGENGSIMVGIFVSCVLASKKSSMREFFVPARTDLAVKLLFDYCVHDESTTTMQLQATMPAAAYGPSPRVPTQ
jgi:hypothetical protein